MRSFAAVGFAVAVAGCAEEPFSPHSRDNVVEDLQRAMNQSQAAKAGPRGAHAMAYLITPAPGKHLAAFDLADEKVLWDVEADVTSRVAVGRGFVAHRQGKASIAVRSSSSGALRCTIPIKGDLDFIGIAADQRVYFVQQTPASSGTTRVSTVSGASPDGCGISWSDEATGSAGAPAARGGVVAVPYAFQNIVLLDGASGAELARVRAKDEQITFVRAEASGFYYGANSGVYLLDVKSATGMKAQSSFTSAKFGSEQIHTFYYWNAYEKAQSDYTAFDRNRLLWRAEPAAESVAFTDGSAYLHSYRYFFAFDAGSGAIKWAYANPRVDVVGSDDAGPSIVFVSADGDVGALDAKSGALAWSKKTGLRVAGATFDAEGFTPPGAGGKAGSVAETLSTIVEDPDARFTAVKVFAVDQMQRVPGKDVTAELVKVILKEGVAPAVAQKAADSLVNRKDAESAPLYREALAVHYDYLADKRPRGVDVLARVSAAIDDKQAAPLLAAHLLDPATPLHALKEIVKALIALGGKDAIQPLKNFVLTYRCDAGYLQDPSSLQLAVDGLLKLGGDEGRRLVTFVGEEPRTITPLVAYLHKSLADTAPRVSKPKAKPGEDRPDALEPQKKK